MLISSGFLVHSHCFLMGFWWIPGGLWVLSGWVWLFHVLWDTINIVNIAQVIIIYFSRIHQKSTRNQSEPIRNKPIWFLVDSDWFLVGSGRFTITPKQLHLSKGTSATVCRLNGPHENTNFFGSLNSKNRVETHLIFSCK